LFDPRKTVWIILAGVLCMHAVGCASRPMTARLNTQGWRDVVQQHFHAGMTETQVQAELDAMGVSRETRLMYPATADRVQVLLARSYIGGGAFIRGGDSTLEFNDLSFVFDESGGLAKVYGFRDSVRYYDGGPAYGPQRPTVREVGWWPGTIPPPVDPLEKATELPVGGGE